MLQIYSKRSNNKKIIVIIITSDIKLKRNWKKTWITLIDQFFKNSTYVQKDSQMTENPT